ncbi:hypothetical protein [Mesorhizobium sp. IMUNJ 23232]|uniref:hypothetical protein n=1 Tax=Mesorhizobium sp. IMUNJ 23232 TaxID=3376064 RepID=UPI0037B19B8E
MADGGSLSAGVSASMQKSLTLIRRWSMAARGDDVQRQCSQRQWAIGGRHTESSGVHLNEASQGRYQLAAGKDGKREHEVRNLLISIEK